MKTFVQAALISFGILGLFAGTSQAGQPADPTKVKELTEIGKRFDFSQGEEAENAFDALTSGRITLRSRLRFWWAEQDGLDLAEAHTIGIRLGYLTQEYNGFRAFVEGNHVTALTPEQYNDGVNGEIDRTFVADTEQTELNQAWFQYETSFDPVDVNLRIGRQINPGIDERLIGNVSTRQGEQTYDAAGLRAAFGENRKYSAGYAYIDKVHRIFDDNGLDYESESHAFRLGYDSENYGQFGFTALLLDLEDDEPELSNQTYGLTAVKQTPNPEQLDYVYNLGVAVQSDFGENPTDYTAYSLYLDSGVSVPEVGIFGGGLEISTSDDGDASFIYPLSTGQRVHRISDTFLTTPVDGLQDYFVFAQNKVLPFDTFSELSYHYYESEENQRSLGQEFNLVTETPITENLTFSITTSYFESKDADFSDLFIGAFAFDFAF